jgi:hypothetical protein
MDRVERIKRQVCAFTDRDDRSQRSQRGGARRAIAASPTLAQPLCSIQARTLGRAAVFESRKSMIWWRRRREEIRRAAKQQECTGRLGR